MLKSTTRLAKGKQTIPLAVVAIFYALSFGLLSTLKPAARDVTLPGNGFRGPVQTPIYFVPETDPVNAQVQFSLRHPAGRTFFTPAEIVTSLRTETAISQKAGLSAPVASLAAIARHAQNQPSVLRVSFMNPDPDVHLTEGTLLSGKVNYLLGNDSSKWRRYVPTYGDIVYESLYPGVDLTYSVASGQLEGTYVVAPGADPNRIGWRYTGASRTAIDEHGNLTVTITGGDKQLEEPPAASLLEQAPTAWQVIDGRRVPVSARYVVHPDGSVGFALGEFDRSRPLVIDPTITYSSYLGGSSGDIATDVAAVGGSGYGGMLVVGYTQSLDFPVANAIQPEFGGGSWDIFVTKLNNENNGLVYSTYIGGSGDDMAFDLFHGIVGTTQVWLTGKTTSPDFPLLNPYQSTLRGPSDAFALILNFFNSDFIYSSYLGGSGDDEGRGVEDSDDSVIIVAGITNSTDFPIEKAVQNQYGGGQSDAFVAGLTVFEPGLFYSTYLGGTSDDEALAVGAEGGGVPVVAGRTTSSNFPIRHAYQSAYGGNGDAFVTRFGFTSTLSIDYSTFLGGSGSDAAYGIVSPGSAATFVTGATTSSDFPVKNAFQTQYAGGPSDAFVTHVGANGNTLSYSSYLGGSGQDVGLSIQKFDYPDFLAYVTGSTDSTDFPIINAVQPQYGGGKSDAFVTRVGPGGTTLHYSTYLGGDAQDVGLGVDIFEVDFNRTDDYAYVAGYTESDNFPLAGDPFQPSRAGGSDAFITKIDPRSLTPTPTPITTATPTAIETATATPHNSTTPNATPTHTPTPTPTPDCSGVDVHPTNIGPPGAFIYVTVPSGWTWSWDPITPLMIYNCHAQYPTGVSCGWSCSFIEPRVGYAVVHVYDELGVERCSVGIQGNQPFCPPTSTPSMTPTSAVTGTPTATSCPIQFTDVPVGSTFYPYIRCLACLSIISGYPDNTFHPNNNVTRGQLSKIVSNAAGFSDSQTTQLFEDVPPGSTFFDYIGRLASRGYISGYPCGNAEPCVPPDNLPYFRPGSNATRGQISKIVSNSAGFSEPHTEQSFQDVPPASTFYDFIERLASRGVMSGYPCGRPTEPCVPPSNLPYFRPNTNATRGQTSKIVSNTFYPNCQPPAR